MIIAESKVAKSKSKKVEKSNQPFSKTRKSDNFTHHYDAPLIVGGLPPPIMPADAPQAPNPYGYDPLESVTPLGHKQLPSAYRRTPNVS